MYIVPESLSCGSHHATMYLRAYADSEGPDQPAHLRRLIRPSLSAKRIIGYYRMYEWRAKARMILCVCAVWSDFACFAHIRRYSARVLAASWEQVRTSIFEVQSTLVISNSKGLPEILRDIRTSTYQICRIEEKLIRLTTFNKYMCNWTLEVTDILKIVEKRRNCSFFPQYFKHVVRFSRLGRDQIFTSREAVIGDKRGLDSEGQLYIRTVKNHIAQWCSTVCMYTYIQSNLNSSNTDGSFTNKVFR